MSLSKVTRNNQITIPASIRKLFHIGVGSIVDFQIDDKGAIVIKPQVLIDESQSWFWTKEWQEGEKEADKDIQNGRTKKFKSVKEMRKHFEK